MSTTAVNRMGGLPGGPVASLQQTLARWTGFRWGAAQRPPTRLEEARELREFALQYQRTDPGFAADLLAAADRHERI